MCFSLARNSRTAVSAHFEGRAAKISPFRVNVIVHPMYLLSHIAFELFPPSPGPFSPLKTGRGKFAEIGYMQAVKSLAYTQFR
jgi:hypothetical protein